MKIRVIIAVMILKKASIFLGFAFTTASVALIPAKNNFVFKMKQGGETGKCLLTKHFLLGSLQNRRDFLRKQRRKRGEREASAKREWRARG